MNTNTAIKIEKCLPKTLISDLYTKNIMNSIKFSKENINIQFNTHKKIIKGQRLAQTCWQRYR